LPLLMARKRGAQPIYAVTSLIRIRCRSYPRSCVLMWSAKRVRQSLRNIFHAPPNSKIARIAVCSPQRVDNTRRSVVSGCNSYSPLLLMPSACALGRLITSSYLVGARIPSTSRNDIPPSQGSPSCASDPASDSDKGAALRSGGMQVKDNALAGDKVVNLPECCFAIELKRVVVARSGQFRVTSYRRGV